MNYITNENQLSDLIQSDKVLISYYKDVVGYKSGVLVAVGPGAVGWSLAHEDEGPEVVTMPKASPIWNTLKQLLYDEAPANITRQVEKMDKYMNWLGEGPNGLEVTSPAFDKRKGLKIAINRAIWVQNNGIKPTEIIPDDLLKDFDKMAKRSYAYFR